MSKLGWDSTIGPAKLDNLAEFLCQKRHWSLQWNQLHYSQKKGMQLANMQLQGGYPVPNRRHHDCVLEVFGTTKKTLWIELPQLKKGLHSSALRKLCLGPLQLDCLALHAPAQAHYHKTLTPITTIHQGSERAPKGQPLRARVTVFVLSVRPDSHGRPCLGG